MSESVSQEAEKASREGQVIETRGSRPCPSFLSTTWSLNQSKTRFLLSYIFVMSLSLIMLSTALIGCTSIHNIFRLSGKQNRCTLDPVIMPNFQQLKNHYQQTEDRSPEDRQGQRHPLQKILYTTFPAFKFPDKFSLHIQCSLVICNTTCPKVRATKQSKAPNLLYRRSPKTNAAHFPSFHSSFSPSLISLSLCHLITFPSTASHSEPLGVYLSMLSLLVPPGLLLTHTFSSSQLLSTDSAAIPIPALLPFPHPDSCPYGFD